MPWRGLLKMVYKCLNTCSKNQRCLFLLSTILKSPFSELSFSTVSSNKCSADTVASCTDPLKVVTDNKDLGLVASRHELDELCP